MADKIFADGLFFKKPDEKAPEFIKGRISVQVDKFTAFLTAHKNESGYVNIDLKKSANGNLYLELNTYKKQTETSVAPNTTVSPDDIPF